VDFRGRREFRKVEEITNLLGQRDIEVPRKRDSMNKYG